MCLLDVKGEATLKCKLSTYKNVRLSRVLVVISVGADRHEAGVVGVVAHVVDRVLEHAVAPVHEHVAFVLGRHDKVVDDRIRCQLRIAGGR